MSCKRLASLFVAGTLAVTACSDVESASAKLELKGISPSTTRAQLDRHLSDCVVLDDPKGRQVCQLDPTTLGTIGRKSVESAKVTFDGQALSQLVATIISDPSEMRDAFAARFGAENFANASLLGQTYSWFRDEGTLEIKQNTEKVNGHSMPGETLSVTLTAKAHEQRAASDRARDL